MFTEHSTVHGTVRWTVQSEENCAGGGKIENVSQVRNTGREGQYVDIYIISKGFLWQKYRKCFKTLTIIHNTTSDGTQSRALPSV